MYAAGLPHPHRDAQSPVGDYLRLAEEILLEVFGYTDTGRDLHLALDRLEGRYRAIPRAVRRHATLARHYQFVRTVALGAGA